MMNPRAEFAGLHLKNPLIVNSSGLTGSVERMKDGTGLWLIVLKSLFEEQIAERTNEQAYV